MAFSFSVYGLVVSVNAPLAALEPLPQGRKEDVRILFGEMPVWYHSTDDELPEISFASPNCDENGETNLKVFKMNNGAYFYFLYSDETRIIVDAEGKEIWATWPDSATIEDTATYLLGTIMGFVLRLRGITCLHASAVVAVNKAIAFTGPQGSGKSTTAATFAKLGYPVLCDDVLALNKQGDSYMVQPGYPRVNVWPESAKALYGTADALPFITPPWEKRYLDLTKNGYHFQKTPLPLGAIYFLAQRKAGIGAPVFENLKAPSALMSLVANTYANSLLDKDMRAGEFSELSAIVQRVPVRQVTPDSDPAKLPQLCEAIIDDFQSILQTRQ